MDSIQVWRNDLQEYLRRIMTLYDPISQQQLLLGHAFKDLLVHAHPTASTTALVIVSADGDSLSVPPSLSPAEHHDKPDLSSAASHGGTWTVTQAMAQRLQALALALPHTSHHPHTPLFFDTSDPLPLISPSSFRSSSLSYPLRRLSKWNLHDRARFLPMVQVPPWRPPARGSSYCCNRLCCCCPEGMGTGNDRESVAIDLQVREQLLAFDIAWHHHHRHLFAHADRKHDSEDHTFEFATLVQASTRKKNSSSNAVHVDPMPGLEPAAHQARVAHTGLKRKSSPNSRFHADMRFSATQKVSDFVTLRKSSTSVPPGESSIMY